MEKQHTIKSATSISGKGLHTGVPVTMTFHPAEPDHGIIFRRTDIEGQPLVHADVDLVVDTSRGTTLKENGAKVHTVEHVMAALMGLGIDNALIDLDGPEPPIMDGSSREFIEKLLETGLDEQDAERIYFEIDESITYSDEANDITLAAFPARSFELNTFIDFGSKAIEAQHANMKSISQFKEEFSSARTFCFVHELEALHQAGLIKGGSLDSAVVIMDKDEEEEEIRKLQNIFGVSDVEIKAGILNKNGFRFPNEPARHKLLDLLGDLALVGMPLKGKIIASRPGHKSNVELAKKIKSKIKQQRIANKFSKGKGGKPGVIFDINAIHEILPHRYPFLLVDKVTDFTESTIRGVKNVTFNEPFFQGHFPGNPIMPGVLQVEAMGQLGGILLLNTIDNPKSIWVYFVAIDNVRFKKPVIPGDTLILELEMTALRRSICKMSGKAYVDGQLVSSADLVASVVPKDKL
ncbi:MAG: bifunctional UDP-3-O-[3-hydroxymyristoyl] N-acetylglucosamine deacetylase/3-hydroxyacyl-ACP dehydratase [Bacteroidia bacterium]|nr:bifunctional UDP-3-O-[3-hydroxymyristoyl] N-acetylglucosamine deacetylase/3-hydroxyacyl-ACP dehydratase [Bacteroidia bacterium]